MKKIHLLAFGMGAIASGFAQSSYQKGLEQNVAKFNATNSANEFEKLKDNFATLIGVDGSDWRSYYYTAATLVRDEISLNKSSQTHGVSAVTATAEKYLSPIVDSQSGNVEVVAIQGFIEYLKSKNSGNSTDSFLKLVEKAEKLDASNPRVLLLRGVYEFNNKNTEKASEFLKKSREALGSKSQNSTEPSWGKDEVDYFLTQISNPKN